MIEIRLGFMGSGEMARAIARGLVGQRVIEPERLWFSDSADEARRRFADEVPGSVSAGDNRELARGVDAVICSVKPHQVAGAIAEAGDPLRDRLLISVAAGIGLSRLAEWSLADRIVRVMPNAACMVGAGASAYCRSERALDSDVALVDHIFSSLGIAVEVAENQLDAVTGLSGSGPAYVAQFVQALADGGVLMGLPRGTAQRLAIQTVVGAGVLLRDSAGHPLELSDRVGSAGGTTLHALEALENRGFRAAVIAAVRAAAERARALSE
jgi:pyrroline-5-carboxylate reductase